METPLGMVGGKGRREGRRGVGGGGGGRILKECSFLEAASLVGTAVCLFGVVCIGSPQAETATVNDCQMPCVPPSPVQCPFRRVDYRFLVAWLGCTVGTFFGFLSLCCWLGCMVVLWSVPLVFVAVWLGCTVGTFLGFLSLCCWLGCMVGSLVGFLSLCAGLAAW